MVAVVDPDLDRAQFVAAGGVHGPALGPAVALSSLAGLDGLPERPVVALVATDIRNLAPVARALLEARLHVLVEKPAAATPGEARQLVETARARDRLLAVGFVERFNGGLASLPALGRRLVIRRVGPCAPTAGPLILDWLIHDLDLALWRLGAGLEVHSVRTLGDGGSALQVRLQAADGRGALLHVDRGRGRSYRRLWLDGRRVDLAERCLADPLTAQWVAFLRRVGGGPSPGDRLACGGAAVAALELAERISRALSRSAPERAAG